MPYIGKSPVGGGFHKLDNLTASATATYALTLGSAAYYPETANQLLVSLNGVIQAPQDSFTVSGSNLIFDSALTASDSIDFVVALGDVLGVQGVTDGAVSTNKIANQAVTMNKLATSGTLPALDGSNLIGVGVAGITSSSTSGTAMSINSSNIISYPTRPRVLLRGYTSQSGGYINAWQQTTYNTGFTITNGTIVVPANGFYQVDGMMTHFSSSNHPNMQLEINGTTYFTQFGLNNWDNEGMHYHQALELTSGDVIRMGWNTSYAGPSTALYATTLGCYLIG